MIVALDVAPGCVWRDNGGAMNARDLNTLIDYHYWARDRLLDALEPLTPEQFTRDMGNSFRSIRDTGAHIYAAEWAWHSRWLGQSPTALLPADMFPDIALHPQRRRCGRALCGRALRAASRALSSGNEHPLVF